MSYDKILKESVNNILERSLKLANEAEMLTARQAAAFQKKTLADRAKAGAQKPVGAIDTAKGMATNTVGAVKKGWNSLGTKGQIGVGVGVGAAALGAAAIWKMKKNRCKKNCINIQDPNQRQQCMSQC
jgi:hypothetical protein